MRAPVNPGDVLADKYTVETVLGMGGMGVVVAARHVDLGERVAIKFLLPIAMAHAEVVARFMREGRAAARIRSEHVARVFDVGKLPDGAPYLVMEYLEGVDLGEHLTRQGPLPIDVAVELTLQACEGLAEAHALGIIHRDLKPGNLFLTRKSDGSACVKLIDFGISKLVGDGKMTGTNSMMGSPLFMAPEQMASSRDVDERADIWSMGIILHTLLTGSPPFLGETPVGVYELILQGTPTLRSVRGDAPGQLEEVLLRCLQRDKAARPANVALLAHALAPFAPAHARSTANRISRILGQPEPPLETAPPYATPLGTQAGVQDPKIGLASTPPHVARAASQPSGSSSGLLRPQGSGLDAGSDGPWNRTHAPARRRSRGVLLGLCALTLVAVVVMVALFVRRSDAPVVATTNASASTAPTAAAPAEPSVTAAGDPAAPPPPSTEAAEASPPSAAPNSATPTATANHRVAAPKPHGTGASPKRDLFEDPR